MLPDAQTWERGDAEIPRSRGTLCRGGHALLRPLSLIPRFKPDLSVLLSPKLPRLVKCLSLQTGGGCISTMLKCPLHHLLTGSLSLQSLWDLDTQTLPFRWGCPLPPASCWCLARQKAGENLPQSCCTCAGVVGAGFLPK